MNWLQFSHGFRLDPIAKGSPEAVVVLLHDIGASAATLIPVAERWATTVPTTAFIVLDDIEQLGPRGDDLPAQTLRDRDDGAEPPAAEPTMLDRATRHLETLLEQQLRRCRLDPSRLVLVGFGYGGTLAVHLLLRRGWGRVGVLAIAAMLMRPLPRLLRVARKIRLIECAGDGHIGHARLRDVVALLTGRGIDARGVLLPGTALSAEATRHGGAYLVELVATAQLGDRFRVDQESGPASRSPAKAEIAATSAGWVRRAVNEAEDDTAGRQS
jgi:predicted esterase